MKKAIYTLFQHRSSSSLLGKLTLMVVFAWCCLGSQSAQAQIQIALSNTQDTCSTAKLETCNTNVTASSTKFTDDGDNDGNYADSRQRDDTIQICGKDAWHTVRVVFTDFDLEEGDTLFAFDGDKVAVRAALDSIQNANLARNRDRARLIGLGSGSGVGVSKAFGGWVDASCDPYLNPSGCMTFILKTDGDNLKGSGWEAWVDCQEKAITFPGATIPSDVQLTCENAPYDTMLTIGNPFVLSCTDTLMSPRDSLVVTVKNEKGVVVKREMLSSKKAATRNELVGRYGVGCYTVTFALYSDTTKVTDPAQFCVKAPALVCNDEVNTVFGAACQLSITPDMVLEAPCDEVTGVLAYQVKLIYGTKTKTGTGANPPTVTKEELREAGAEVCDGELTVEITRTITAPTESCSNDPEVVKCSTIVKYTDNTAPVFEAHTPSLDTLIACDAASVAALISSPSATDNCDSVRVVSTADAVDFSDVCVAERKVVIRHKAYDECGNASAELTDTVVIMRPTVFSLPGIDSLECNAEDPGYKVSGAPRLKIGNIKNGVTTFTDSIEVDTSSYTCGYILSYTDQVIDEGDCGSKVFRAWSYVDWCNGSQGPQAIGTQFIHYFDQSAPEFTYTGADTLETGATKIDFDFGECTKVISPTAPSAVDGCDDNPTVAMYNVARKDGSTYTSMGANLTAAGALGCDTFRISWRVYDDCHTQTVEDTIHRYFILQDVEYPIVICEDEVFVSVSNSAGAVMDKETFYTTATDNCEVASVLVRRQGEGDDQWRESILVTCTDVDHNSFNVEVQVTDKNGRKNTCWVKVTPEDKIAPICEDLDDDISRTCDEFHNGELGASTDADGDGEMEDSEWVIVEEGSDLEKILNTEFGKPTCQDNLDECGAIIITQSYQLIEENCGVIRIKRKWSATDWGSQGGVNTSQEQEQSITINYKQDWTLTFPKDEVLTCGDDGIPAAATHADIVRSGACDNFVLNVTEETFATPGETCMKLIRTYELINWCVYDVNKPAYVIPHDEDGTEIDDEDVADDEGRFTYSQVIKLDVSDAEPIVTQNRDEIITCIVGVGDAGEFNEEDKGPEPGDLDYECDTVRIFTASAVNCLGIPLTRFTHRVTADGDEIANGEGNEVRVNVEPGKEYAVTFNAFDDCNNAGSSTEIYEFTDCKRPTPYVLNGIAIELGQNGTVDLWATDLNQNSYDNCTDQKDLEFYISREKRPEHIDSIRATGSNISLNCFDVGTRVIYIYVVDAAGNFDFVETFVLVESNMFDCSDIAERDGMVAGHIVNPNGENVEQVSVSVTGAMQQTMTTAADGAFQFSLTTGEDYTVTPVKDMNPLNGVSTFDLVLISKHILGITPFDSPYKYIAADVNKSGTITAFDMVQLRQLILNINTEFSNNDSWRFVDADYDFSVATTNPAAQDFAEFKNVSQLATDMMNLDFVGVKIGDVNGSAAANSLLGAESRTTDGTLNFNVTDRLVEVGETVTVDFTSADIATAQGYQFTMNFAGLDLAQLEEGVVKAANFNTNLAQRGLLTTSWNGEATANDVLFSLTFNATTTGLLSELISVSSDLTEAEAYNTDGELLDVNIEFATAAAVEFTLAQNVPNPFNGETVVGFNLPVAGVATLTVMDVQGKVLKEIKGDYAKGYNTVVLKAKELTTGVLYYQLESADQVATNKMIIID